MQVELGRSAEHVLGLLMFRMYQPQGDYTSLRTYSGFGFGV